MVVVVRIGEALALLRAGALVGLALAAATARAVWDVVGGGEMSDLALDARNVALLLLPALLWKLRTRTPPNPLPAPSPPAAAPVRGPVTQTHTELSR